MLQWTLVMCHVSVFEITTLTLYNLNSGTADLLNQFPQLPSTYIKIVPHPHSGEPAQIISLDGHTTSEPASTLRPQPDAKPWAPFRNRADFEFTESMVEGLSNKKLVDKHLQGMHGGWSRMGSNITFHNHRDMEDSLEAAASFFVPVSRKIPSAL